jgi:hypothetical protein
LTLTDANWARCRGWIEAALEYADGAYEIEDIEACLRAGEYILLSTPNSALIAEINQFPRLRALNIPFAGGDLDEIKSLDPALVEIARAHECTRIYLSGRRGWARTLAPLGYGDLCATVSKEV